jgi:RNA polymerase sigma-70 factor, ECF subfamily
LFTRDREFQRGIAALRLALWQALQPPTACGTPAFALATAGPAARRDSAVRTRDPDPGRLFSEAVGLEPAAGPGGADGEPCSSEEDEAERSRLIALVELARGGDSEAFGMLYDHYNVAVYRFLYYRVGSVQLAEDLMSETFFRALRSMGSFRWQGKDFGAWLMTIARNLATDHFKAGRTRLETATEDMSVHDGPADGPETTVLASLTNEALLVALKELPAEQQECLIMRFLQGLSIAETASVLGRSDGAVKQLQLRGVRNLAKLLPEGLR